MTIAPMTPLLAVDWEKVDMVRVTLEKPFGRAGGLRWRQGTTPSKKNLTYNAHSPEAGPPDWPGVPIMWPEDAPAIANTEADSFLMPLQAAMTAFGHFYAPMTEPKNGITGFTQGNERTRIAAFWGWYKMPPGDGTMMPPMNRIAAPSMPEVAIRPLNRNLAPLKIDGEDVVIRPFQFWKFDDETLYDSAFGSEERQQSKDENAVLRAEVAELRALIQAKVTHGKV